MDKINRYLYQVKRYLSGKNSEDIIEELRSLILDELEVSKESSDKEDEVLLNDILKHLGHPRSVAAKYSGQDTVILDSLTPIFWMVVKILAIVIPLALILGSGIDFFMQDNTSGLSDFILHMILTLPQIASAILASIGVLFLVFHGISRSISDDSLNKLTEFKPSRLPKVPESGYKLKMVEASFEIIAGSIFLYILNYQQGVFSIYQNGESIQFLNDSFDSFLIFINISLGLRIFITLAHIYMNRKTFVTKTAEFMLTLYSATILIALAFSDVLNDNLIETYELSFLPDLFSGALILAMAISLIVGAIDYGKMLFTFPRESLKDTDNQ
jgi:hypothetical protein